MDLHTPDHEQEHAPHWIIPVPPRHRQHPKTHPKTHRGRGNQGDEGVCLACVVQLLEEEEEDRGGGGEGSVVLTIRKEHVLAEFLHLLQYARDDVISLLTSDGRVTLHVVMVLLGLTSCSSEPVVATANEVAYQVLVNSESDELIYCTLQHIAQESVRVCNYKKCVPSLSILGRLMHALPTLPDLLLQNFGSYVDYLCCGLAYPDTDVRTAILYICVHMYSSAQAVSLMPVQLHVTVARALLDVLKGAGGQQELSINALGLLKVMLENDRLTEHLMKQSTGLDSIASVLKKLLLSNQELLQLATAQCTSLLLQRGQGDSYTQILLQADMPEFLFEVLNSTNEMLISCVYRCLRLMADCRLFFDKCHAVYGIEALLRSLQQLYKQKNFEELEQGLELLAVILDRHTGGIRLLSTLSVVSQLCKLLESVIENKQTSGAGSMTRAAATAYIHMLRKNQLPVPCPFSTLIEPLLALGVQVGDAPIIEKQNVKDREMREQCHQLIVLFNEALYKSILLVKNCTQDPTASSVVYAAPDGTEATPDEQTENYIQQLITLTYNSALVAVMANHDSLSNSRVYELLFDSLCMVYEVCPPIATTFSQNLCQINFIPFVLTAKLKLQGENGGDETNANKLISLICTTLTEESMEIQTALKHGLPHIKGGAGDVLCLLRQHAPPGSMFQHVHHSLVLLLNLTASCNNCFVSEGMLREALVTYFSLHQLDNLSDDYVAQLIYLFCLCRGESDSVPNIDTMLHSRLCSMEDVSAQDCLSLPPVVHWLFMDEDRAEGTPAALILSVLMTSQREDSFEMVVQLVRRSIHCVKALLKVLVCGNTDDVQLAAQILENNLSTSSKECSSEVLLFLQSALHDLLTTAFTDHHELPQDENLRKLIELNTTMLQTVDVLPETNLQLLYHLRELITRQKHSMPVQMAVITYLNILLTQRHTVATVLLSDTDFLHWLKRHVVTETAAEHADLCALCFIMLALLLHQQTKHKLKVEQAIILPVDSFLSSLSSPSHDLALPSLLVWNKYLCSDRQLAIFQEESVGRSLGKREIRLLYIYLQQCLIKDNPLVQQLCVICIRHLLHYALEDERLIHHLYQQPWNKVLLQTLCAQYDHNIPKWLTAFILMMVQNNPGNVSVSLRDELLQQYQEAVQIKRSALICNLFPLVQFMVDQKLVSASSGLEKALVHGKKLYTAATLNARNTEDEEKEEENTVFFAVVMMSMLENE